jgi:hypothetical protein
VEAKAGQLLVLADISGYTRFVGGTVLEHGRLWTTRLLELVASRLAPVLTLSAVEGDALVFYGQRNAPDPMLVPLLLETYRDFRRTAESIDPCTGCACEACDSGKELQLKYIIHAGPYIEQNIAGRAQLFGHDVNVACRLLKNHIPAKQYAFVTDAASTIVPLAADAVAHIELADFGEVRGRYQLLS